jgi:PAS domain S-box-containing protein
MRNQESEAIAQALHSQQTQTHLVNLPWAVSGSLGTALCFAYVQWGAASSAVLFTWLGCVAAALLLRVGTGILHWRTVQSAASDRIWLRWHRIGFLVHGMAWGGAAFLPIPASDIAHQAVTLVLLFGVASASFAVTSFDLVAALAFGVPVLGMLSTNLFTLDGSIYPELALVACGGLVFMCLTARRAHLFVRSYMARRLAEAAQADALRSSEELLERTGATAGVGGWEFDVASQRLRFTHQAYRILGFEPGGQPVLESFFACYPSDRLPDVRAAFDAARTQGEPFDLELPLTTGAGERKWVRLIGQPLRDAGATTRVSGVVQDITAKKLTEIELAEKHHLLTLLVQTTSEGFWFIDPIGVTTDANPAMCRILGRRREDIIGRSIFDFVDAANAAIFRQEIQRRADGQAGDYEIALQWPDGSLVDCFNHATPIFNSLGRRVGSIGMWTDITERKRVEVTLRATSEQLSQKSHALQVTLDSITQGIVTLDAAGRPLVYNQRVLELLDLPGSLLEPPNTYDDVVRFQISRGEIDVDAGFVNASSQQRVLGADRANLPEVYVRRTAAGSMVEVRTRQLPDGALVRTYADVTAYFDAQQALRDSEAQMRALLDAFPGFISVVDSAFRYTYVNSRMAELWGREREDLIGRSVLELMGAEVLGRIQSEVAQLRPGHPVTVEREYAAQASRPPTWLQVTHALSSDDTGVSKYYAFGVDITERKRVERELIVARDQAERANRAKSQFLSSMSHELRTPMNAILGFGQLLVSDPTQPLTGRQGQYVNEILRGARHLLNLINEVLDLALVEAGRLQVSIEPVNLGELLRDCLGLMDPLARSAGIRIELADAELDRLFVLADRTRLKQVVLNLVSNAIKYNRPNGQVRIDCASRAGMLRLAVADTGPGLSPLQQERLFEAFERLDATGTPVEGAGLGLALSKQLMTAMAGEIGLTSTVGVGSTFWIRLPRAAAPVPVEPLAAGDRPARLRPGRGERRVLYIEDNPVNVLLMEAMLARVGDLRLITAALPEQGLQMAVQERPDLILLDIQLPGMDGFEVLRRLRLDGRSQDIPVIAVSANAMPADVEHGLAAGFAEYLTKPLDMQRLLQAVEGTFAES